MPKPYDRLTALHYAKVWSLKRNPLYYDFSELGGDCTNFVSQCLYAGCRLMNPTPDIGWYYHSVHDRSPSWTGVSFLYQFLLSDHHQGPYAEETLSAASLFPGDIIQFGNAEKGWHHSLLVLTTNKDYNKVRIATHSVDAYGRLLSSYAFSKIRFLHIIGIKG